jgi:hypothetical protein
MTNLEFHELITKIINRVTNDKMTGNSIEDIECSLNKYGLNLETIKVFNETIEYEKVFLTIYYDVVRICQIYCETNPDGDYEPTIELTHSYIKTAMRKAGILNEYKVTSMSNERYLRLKTEKNIK